jgi:REP element-mobilizing transposase RayT
MPFIKVYIHFVWNTKTKISFLAIKQVRKIIWNHIRANAKKNGIRVDFINGYSDYYHCLIDLETDQTIEKVIGILKGEKTFWINKKGFSTESFPAELPSFLNTATTNKFEWKDDYFAIAVSESTFKRVSNYSQNQLDDNEEKLFNKEYKEYVIKYGFQKFVDE